MKDKANNLRFWKRVHQQVLKNKRIMDPNGQFPDWMFGYGLCEYSNEFSKNWQNIPEFRKRCFQLAEQFLGNGSSWIAYREEKQSYLFKPFAPTTIREEFIQWNIDRLKGNAIEYRGLEPYIPFQYITLLLIVALLPFQEDVAACTQWLLMLFGMFILVILLDRFCRSRL